MYDPHRQRLFLALLLIAYLGIGVCYAALTPAWQVPDEPAHYNYVRQLASGQLPVIAAGDYDQESLNQLLAEGFPPEAQLDWLQYEDHQPPLYYLLAAPIFALFHGALFPLRLFSLALGVGLLIVAWRIARLVFPNRPVPQWIALSLIAFIPQHIAMLAGVNNDSLAELLLALTLLAAVALVQGRRLPPPWVIGLLLGAAFWTKIPAYIAAPVFGLAILLRWRQEKGNWGWRWLLAVFGPALALGLAWWGRNLAIYGGLDWMGLGRHDQVVLGQPTTTWWIVQHGLPATLSRFFQFTFQSFWGMFGWMGVAMPGRIYQALLVLSGLVAVGLILSAWLQRRDQQVEHRAALAGRLATPLVLLASAGATTAGYLWYNLSYVQHQGRYLFPALIPIALAAGVGVETLLQRRAAGRAALIVVLAALIALMAGSRFFAALLLLAGFLCLAVQRVAPRHRGLLVAALSAALATFSLFSLLQYVVPQLS